MSPSRTAGVALLAPAVLLFIALTVVPFVQVVAYSTMDTDFITTRFVGAANYVRVITSAEFPMILVNTLTYVAIIGGLLTFLPLLIATMIYDASTRYKRLVLIAMVMPIYSAGLVICPFVRWMFHPTAGGLVNGFLGSLGREPVLWFSERFSSIAIIATFCVWSGLGAVVVYYLANIQAIPESVFEAARLDGASRKITVRHIVLPILRQAIALEFVLAVLGALFVIEFIYFLTQGGPRNGTTNLMYWIYDTTNYGGKYGRACAINMILVVVALVLSFVRRAVGRGI